MFLKDFWYVLCASHELADRPFGRVVCGEPMVVYRTGTDDLVALRDVCPHRRAPLSMGTVVGDVIRCGYHGMEFNSDGRCVKIPSQDSIPKRADVPTFPAIERYGFIWVWPGELENADPDSLANLAWRDDETWDHSVVQYFAVNSSHQLMVDNLLDLSHVAFLHANTIGFNQNLLVDDPLEVVIEPRMVRTERVFRGTTQAAAHKQWSPLTEPIDRTQLAQWFAPSTVTVLVRNENEEQRVDLRADHFITPESADTHHYYVAISRNFRVDDSGFSQTLDDDTRTVHLEDVEIAEAQQRLRRWTPGERDMALQADRAVNAAHRILKELADTTATPPT